MKEVEQHWQLANLTLKTYEASLAEMERHTKAGPTNFVDRLIMVYLQRMVADLKSAIAGQCPEDPARLKGMPIGQYHCPECGCMVVAGMEGHPHEVGCVLGLYDPDLDPEVIALRKANRKRGRTCSDGPERCDDDTTEPALDSGRPGLNEP